jgi:hypothetical protein
VTTMGDELWAWQVEEQPDVWSLVGAYLPALGSHSPLIHRNRDIAQKMEPLARSHAEQTGQPLRLAHFTLAEVVTT